MNAVPELMFTMLPPPCARITGITACIDDWSQHIEMEDFVKKRRFDLLYCGCIATACIVYETVDPAVMLVHSAYRFAHSIKLRHVYGDWQAAWNLPRQLLQRIGAASEEGDFCAATGQRYRRRQADPRRSTRDNENAFFDLHRSILLVQFDQYPSISEL
jgi:hypothetical protein